jgi:8-oxo-dGTP pyrophosphatase MutT (NUDIX family)
MAPVKPLPAATLLVVRERKCLEVYMTRRHPNLNFLAGHYVFPGGRRDKADYCKHAVLRMFTKDLGQKAGEVDSDETMAKKLGYYAAAIREAFEEAGVLVACKRGGGFFVPDEKQKKSLESLRKKIHGGKMSFLEMLRELDLCYDLDRLHWFSHWVTPEFSPKRFDTQFFLAELPEGQTPAACAEEVDQELWIAPEKALERWGAADLLMIPPTVASLKQLSQFKSFKESVKRKSL